jgi:hypothetical protein
MSVIPARRLYPTLFGTLAILLAAAMCLGCQRPDTNDRTTEFGDIDERASGTPDAPATEGPTPEGLPAGTGSGDGVTPGGTGTGLSGGGLMPAE